MKDIKPKKSLGQHWLYDESTLLNICHEADISKDDVVLEVGPGLGTLTNNLVEMAKRVVAVEFDSGLAAKLDENKPGNLEVLNEDILSFDTSKLESGYKVVANIPYYLTSHLIRRLLESENKPSVIVLLIQKEVAERIVAKPGGMSLLSVSAQFYADVRLGGVVKASMFTPPPKVDSQVVVLNTKSELLDVEIRKFFRIVKAGFGEKRKKLSNSLAGGLNMDKDTIASILSELGFSDMVRAQELDIQDWFAIYNKISVSI